MERDWVSVRIDGYRKTYALRPGQSWRDAPVSADQYEHLVLQDDEPVPVGVAIARELMASGADWAYCTELWGGSGPVLLDQHGMCVSPSSSAAAFLQLVREVNNSGFGGLPDVIAQRGDIMIVREAKLGRGRDKLRNNQHSLIRSLRTRLGDRLDAAVIEWQVSSDKKTPT